MIRLAIECIVLFLAIGAVATLMHKVEERAEAHNAKTTLYASVISACLNGGVIRQGDRIVQCKVKK